MKKLLLSAVLATSFGVTGLASAATAATADGSITFNGGVTSSTCTVNVNGSGTNSGTVTLPTVQSSDLNTVGNTTGVTSFTIALTSCNVATTGVGKTSVVPYFLPGTNTQSDGNLSNTASGGAGGVEIFISKDGTYANKLNLNASTGTAGTGQGSTPSLFSSTLSPTFTYYAGYYAVAAITPGAVTSSVQFNLSYQ
jgi:major type 1 subunit fimbrin (pilin)